MGGGDRESGGKTGEKSEAKTPGSESVPGTPVSAKKEDTTKKRGKKKKSKTLPDFFKRVLRRYAWKRMEGLLEGETVDKPPDAHSIKLAYKSPGKNTKKWKSVTATLELGILKLGDGGGAVETGLCVIQFEENRRQVELGVANGEVYRLKVPKKSKWSPLISALRQHRRYQQSEFLRGSSVALSGTLEPSAAGVPILLQGEDLTRSPDPDKSTPDYILATAALDQAQERHLASLKELKRQYITASSGASSQPQGFASLFRSAPAKPPDFTRLLETADALIKDLESSVQIVHREATRIKLIRKASEVGVVKTRVVPDEGDPLRTASELEAPEASFYTSLCSGDSSEEEDESESEPPTEPKPDKKQQRVAEVKQTGDQVSKSDTKPETKTVVKTLDPKAKLRTASTPTLSTVKTPVFVPRDKLPAPQPPAQALTLKALLKAINESSLPLYMFEPLSLLQRLAEQLEYAELLSQALAEGDETTRMALVCGFVISALSGTLRRTSKPFNPLLGETFALDRMDERGWRYYSEQVSHSPDISAFAVDGRGWSLSGVIRAGKPRLGFSTISILPTGTFNISFYGKLNETYRYNPIESCVTNPSSTDKRRLCHVGTFMVACSNGLVGCLSLHGDSFEVKGKISGPGKETLAKMEGKWPEQLRVIASRAPVPRIIFKANALPVDEPLYYGFSQFARELNQPLPDSTRLPPTDSRLRPDIRAFENARLVPAQEAKKKLEEAQRKRKVNNASARPIWFRHSPSTLKSDPDPLLAWTPTNTYWTSAATTPAFNSTTFSPIFQLQS